MWASIRSGHQRAVAQVDDLRAGRMRHRRAGGADAGAFDQHFARADDAARVDLEESRGVEDDGLGRLG